MSDIDMLRIELSEFSRRSFKRHLVSATGGNLNLRVPGTDTILVTPRGISLGDIEPQMNLLIHLNGTILDSPMDLKGSKETGFHLEAYRNRQECAAVAHFQPAKEAGRKLKGIH
jgi:ribulose-5-phosphate 4-epimerase/fuculose-1-phosphate aldolase